VVHNIEHFSVTRIIGRTLAYCQRERARETLIPQWVQRRWWNRLWLSLLATV